MSTILALLEGLGYQAVPAVDSPINHGIPHDRKRDFISILRSDHADKWGLHAATAPRPPHVFTPIEDMLLPADHVLVVAEFAAFDQILRESGMSSALVPANVDARRIARNPVLAWKCGDGGFGCRGFTNAVPAIKVYGEGP
jgi:hypothetical protein